MTLRFKECAFNNGRIDILMLIFWISQTETALWITPGGMVFCYQNCFELLWDENVLLFERTFEIWGWRLITKGCLNQSILKLHVFTSVLFPPKKWWFLSAVLSKMTIRKRSNSKNKKYIHLKFLYILGFISLYQYKAMQYEKLFISCRIVPYFIKNISTFKDENALKKLS